ncbi:hypothetical protein MSG28_015426 [Choristoneura fumiferana]|uniref:Uncharacterized protein n=1 Tax=Choristoneura fumiferana TaxID=7141 RepID=A0ACC0KB16_CHOFU|nr:hypothetical protein MSG28_015426 [Choristoneura fumiferana]
MSNSARHPKTTPITDDYDISNTVLGLGINGKLQYYNRHRLRAAPHRPATALVCFKLTVQCSVVARSV